MRAHGAGAPHKVVDGLSGTAHRVWWRVHAKTPEADEVTLRWRFTTDASYTARGVMVDGIRVTGVRGTILDGERHPEQLKPRGFTWTDR